MPDSSLNSTGAPRTSEKGQPFSRKRARRSASSDPAMGSPEDTVPFDPLFERALRSSRNLSDPFHLASGTDRGRRPARNQRPAPQLAQHRNAARSLGQTRNSSSPDPQAGQRRSSDEAQGGTPGACWTASQERSAAANETSKAVLCRTYPLSAALAIRAAVALSRAALSASPLRFPARARRTSSTERAARTSGSFPMRRRSRGFSSKNSRGPRRVSRKLAPIHTIPPELPSNRNSSSAKPPSASDWTSARARSRPSDEMTVATRWAKPTSSACSFSSSSALVSTVTPAKLSSENVISNVV